MDAPSTRQGSAGIDAACGMAVDAATPPVAGAVAHTHAPSAGSSWDFFTNDGTYMPRTHSLVDAAGRTDWPWVLVLLVATVGVIVGYARIFHFWVRCHQGENRKDRNPSLMELAWIFLWCAVCGYAMSIVMFLWPGYRLLAVCLIVLNWWTWKFASRLPGFKSAFTAGRLERELADALRTRNDELERLVVERAAEGDEARRAAESASRAKTDFLAHMSHEIRTPMSAILGYAELLNHSSQTDEQRESTARTIHQNGEHLMAVLNDLLDISKIEAGQVTIEPLDASPACVAGQVLELMAARAKAKGIALRLEAAPGLRESIVTDAMRLRQILLNLVGNALKFTQRGEVVLTVRPARGDSVAFEVRDSGIGMTTEQMARIFQPFTQADASMARRFGGTGLGLVISRRLARLLGGDVEVSSTPGVGSVFTLTITPPAPSPTATAHPGPARPEPGTPTPGDRKRILLVEDGLDNSRLFAHHLRRAGFTVELAQDGLEACERVEADGGAQAPYALVLMDMQMPRLDGYAATARLRAMGFRPPILALTAHAMTQDRDRCLAAGCSGYLTKPIEGPRLIAACREAMREPVASRAA